MKYFLDTNILLDNFLQRQPFNFHVRKFLIKADENNWQLYVSDISFVNAHYTLKKKISNEIAVKIITDFVNQVEVVSITKPILLAAGASNFKDYEDAIQFHCATSVSGINGIITRNLKDFKESTIPVYSPEQVLY